MARTRRSLFLDPPPDDCAEVYRVLCHPTYAGAAAARQRCEDMWLDFHDLADGDFIERFARQFHARWFEMYLGATLRRAGLIVDAPKPGPDLRLLVDGRQVRVEAIAATAGDPLHADHVRPPIYRDSDGSQVAARVPHDQITLRLAEAFRSKADKFDSYRLRGRIGSDDPCVIAINLHEVPHSWPDALEFWHRSLYGVGDRFAALDPTGSAPPITGRTHRELLHHSSGAPLDVMPLLRPAHASISAVLGSSADVWNVPSPPGDDFVLMPHSAPSQPLPRSLLKRGREIVLHADGDKLWRVETIDHGAFAPRGPERIVIPLAGKVLEVEWEVEGRELTVRAGGRGLGMLLKPSDDPVAVAREVAIEMAGARR